MWTALADFHIRRGAFEVARDVYEEGLSSVATVRDFGLIFDALSHFEESLLAAKMAAAGTEWIKLCSFAVGVLLEIALMLVHSWKIMWVVNIHFLGTYCTLFLESRLTVAAISMQRW